MTRLKLVSVILGAVLLTGGAVFGVQVYGQGANQGLLQQWRVSGNDLTPRNSEFGLSVPGLASSTTGCLSVSASGWISPSGSACGGGGASFGNTWAFPSGITNAISPTTTVGVIVNASSSITNLSIGKSTTTQATTTYLNVGMLLNVTGNALFTNATGTNLGVTGTFYQSGTGTSTLTGSLSVGSGTVGATLSLQNWQFATSTVVCMYPETCQYQADGTADNVQIDAAIEKIAKGGGGVVYIKKGLYNIAAAVSQSATNTAVIGDGIGQTILKASAAVDMMRLGLEGAGDWYVENVLVKGITFDLNSVCARGPNVSNTRNVLIEQIEVKNSCSGGGGNSFQLVVGNLYTLSDPDGYAQYFGKDITIRDSIFRDNPHATVENINLEQAKNVLFEGNRCENIDNVGGCLYVWHAENVAIIDNKFIGNGDVGVDGRGPVTIAGNTFEDSELSLTGARNVTVQGNTFKTVDFSAGSAGITVEGSFATGSEGAWYDVWGPTPTENIVIDGNTFTGVWSTSISAAGTYASSTEPTVFYPNCRSMTVSNNTFYQDRFNPNMQCLNLTVEGNQFIENNQGAGAQTAGVQIGGQHVIVTNNQAFVNSATTTQTYGIVFRNEIEEKSIITGMTVQMGLNRLEGGIKYRHFGPTGTTIQSTGNLASSTWVFNETNNLGLRSFLSLMSTSTTGTSSLFTVLNSGRVGIGSTTPGTALGVTGDAVIAGTTTVRGLISTSTATSTFQGGINAAIQRGCLAVNGTCVLTTATLPTATSSNVFDVRGWGANFEDLTDDTTAITNAINDAKRYTAFGGAVVEFPKGIGYVSATLPFYSDITFRGQGASSSLLQWTAFTDGAAFKASTTADRVVFEKFGMSGMGENASPQVHGIMFDGDSSNEGNRLEDLTVEDFSHDCIHWEKPVTSQIENVKIDDCGRDGLFAYNATSLVIQNSYATGADRSNWHLQDMTYSKIIGTASEYSTYGYWIEGGSVITIDTSGVEVVQGSTTTVPEAAAYRVQDANNVSLINTYSTDFASIDVGSSSAHYWISSSTNVLLQAPRGRSRNTAEAGTGVQPTHTVYCDYISRVTIEMPQFREWLKEPTCTPVRMTDANFHTVYGTTTPTASSTPHNWTVQIASSTPWLVLTSTSSAANQKHWGFNNSFGTLYIATSSDAYASSSRAALTLNTSGQLIGSLVDYGGTVYDVRAYGARCDGTTDDSAAVTAAINAANNAPKGGGVVMLPAGVCNMGSASLPLYSDITIRGQGATSSILHWNGGSVPSNAGIYASTSADYVSLEDFGVQGPGNKAGGSVPGIYVAAGVQDRFNLWGSDSPKLASLAPRMLSSLV